ncbi:MAG: glutamate dehydrogenase, partial [Sulfolobaceae archaeon]|nr:glutamate dehydrogenase [Sulfolobaceae archaeon]MCY0860765.1 glutamate dehydrogenase [Sulfolobaceae archaeon]
LIIGKMNKAFDEVYAMANKLNSDLRTAAMAIAVDRVVRAMKVRGML